MGAWIHQPKGRQVLNGKAQMRTSSLLILIPLPPLDTYVSSFQLSAFLIHLRYHTLGSSRLLVGKRETGFIGIAKFCAPMYASRASSSRYFYCLYLSVFSLLIRLKLFTPSSFVTKNTLPATFSVPTSVCFSHSPWDCCFIRQFLLANIPHFWKRQSAFGCACRPHIPRTASVKATSEENASPVGAARRPRAVEVTSSESADVVVVIVNFPWARPYVNALMIQCRNLPNSENRLG